MEVDGCKDGRGTSEKRTDAAGAAGAARRRGAAERPPPSGVVTGAGGLTERRAAACFRRGPGIYDAGRHAAQDAAAVSGS